MKKFKFSDIKNIRFNVIWAWQACVVAFLAILVILSLLDAYMFVNTGKIITSPISIPSDIKTKIPNRVIFEKAVSDLKAREEIFEKGSREKPGIKDPSL